MYPMKKIVAHDSEILLPKCMYTVKNRTNLILTAEDDTNINISNQVIKFLKGSNSKMTELEKRQDQLLKKLDNLYDRIKTISSYCNVSHVKEVKISKNNKACLPTPQEVVLITSPDSLPWFLSVILKQSPEPIHMLWHIHSSVPNDKVAKVKNFVNNLPNSQSSNINLRLIFKCVSADTELKLSSLAVPIIGNVNILRYLSYVYPNVVPYNPDDHQVDYLLDLCHLLERTPEKNKEAIINKLCSQYKDWLYGDEYSIVDLAAFNIVKQWKNIPKSVPKSWFDKLCS